MGTEEEVVTRTILCLANSRKTSGRCIAGKEYLSGRPGPWIRPVSSRSEGEISEEERQYSNGADPQVLDIVTIPLLGPFVAERHPFQTENFRIDSSYYWENAGRVPFAELANWTDNPATLWVNSFQTYHGINDRVPDDQAVLLTDSLYLLRLQSLSIHVFAPGADFGNLKRRVQVDFSHRGIRYKIWTGDPRIEREFLAKPDGTYDLGAAYVTVSLAEPYDGFCYKVAATILPDAWNQ